MEDEDRVDSIDPVVRCLRQAEETIAKGPNAPAMPDISPNQITVDASSGVVIGDGTDLDFGDKDFTVIVKKDCGPLVFYINKRFCCPTCAHEGEYQTNLEGPPKQKMYCPMCLNELLKQCPIMKLIE